MKAYGPGKYWKMKILDVDEFTADSNKQRVALA